MLVYSSMLHLMDQDPRAAVRAALQTWLESKLGIRLSDEDLRPGRHPLTERDLLEIEEFDFIEENPPDQRRPEHDWATAYRYSHPDAVVHGRRWFTEVGLSVWSGTMSYATVRLHTEEQSALAHAPIATTRPSVTGLIEKTCKLHRKTPGGIAREVRKEDIDAFLSLVHDRHRRHPILLVRCADSGLQPVNPERVAQLCLGIAEVAVVSTTPRGRLFPRGLGDLLPEPGALNILWPIPDGDWRGGVARTRVRGPEFEEWVRGDIDPAGCVLARVCHETNATVSGWHIDLTSVRTLRLQFDLRRVRQKLEQSASPEQLQLLTAYEQCEKEDRAKIESLKRDLEHANNTIVAERAARGEAERNAAEARLKADALERALQDVRRGTLAAGEEGGRLRAAVERVLQNEPTLDDTLVVLDHLFADRLVILDTAWKSARAAAKFRSGQKAFDLLWKLCTGYHEVMCAGGGDKQALQVFGNTSFAARESETVENNTKARSLRTFVYQGETIEMVRHLKIGVKPSDATTFRAHFHWDAAKKTVVLGHCGGHLDHD